MHLRRSAPLAIMFTSWIYTILPEHSDKIRVCFQDRRPTIAGYEKKVMQEHP